MSAPRMPLVLVRRGFDGLLVGWLAVIVWIAVFAAGQFGIEARIPALSVIYWTGAVITAAHFGLSYHLAYRAGPDALRQRPLALLWGPLVLVGVLAFTTIVSLRGGTAVTTRTTEALISAVYLATTWHYVKQVYGVGRVGAVYAGISLTSREVTVLRYGVYPLWFLGAAQVLVRRRASGMGHFLFGYDILPAAAVPVLQAIAVCSALPVACVVATAVRRTRRFPSLLVAPYAAAFLWLSLPTNPTLTVLLLAPFHALQYLAIGHRAEVSLATETPDAHGVMWWLNIFAGAACGGLLLSRWAPAYLDDTLSRPGALLFTAAFFVFLNLHHYLIDASIWRSKGDLVKSLVRRNAAVASPTAGAREPSAGAAALPVS